MALLNPPELRASVMCVALLYLAQRRGQGDDADQIIDAIAPPSLSSDPGKLQLDARRNLVAVVELGLATRTGDRIKLTPAATKAAGKGPVAMSALIRDRVLSEELNTAPWGSQEGARDLTNALAWFLSFSPAEAPNSMERASPSAKSLQERDFGPRHSQDDESSGWPISNDTRWNAFQRWACALGFAWRSPARRLIPDPTPVVRGSLPSIFGAQKSLDAHTFVGALGTSIPVLETGAYRRTVEQNWKRPPRDVETLSPATSEALLRLAASGHLKFEDRADSSRVRRFDGSTFSHVSKGHVS